MRCLVRNRDKNLRTETDYKLPLNILDWSGRVGAQLHINRFD